jgi:hypothetical protein
MVNTERTLNYEFVRKSVKGMDSHNTIVAIYHSNVTSLTADFVVLQYGNEIDSL